MASKRRRDQAERGQGKWTKNRGAGNMTRTRTCEHAHIVVSGHVLLRPNSTKSRRYFRKGKFKESAVLGWRVGAATVDEL